MESKDIIINLDTLDSTEVRGEAELIFREQFEQLVRKIRRKASENKRWLDAQAVCERKKGEANDESRSVPSCFFIDGSRGSGKSTLMRAVREELVNGKIKSDESIRLYPLADIDPTELGKGENFFLYLLGRIYKLLENKFNVREERDEVIEDIRSAMEDLRKMSGALQVLMDSDAALKKSDNPDFFLENCVDKCADSTQLRKKLCALLGKVSRIVCKDVFLVTIDDADLNFSKCEDVLEYVRKYMQTPRLIFLFAGDLQLYSHVVRGIHMKSFGNRLLQYDKSHEVHRNQMVDCLEDQYLLKLFPADFRVKMPTIGEIPNAETRMQVLVDNQTSTLGRHLFYEYMRGFLYHVFGTQSEMALDALLRTLPLRSILFMLQDWSRSTAGIPKGTEEFSKRVTDGLQSIALPALVKYNINYVMLRSHDTQTVIEYLVKYFSDTDAWKTNLDFVPRSGGADELLISTYLGSIVAGSTQSLASKFLYLFTLYPQSYRMADLYSGRFENGKIAPSLKKQEDWSSYGAIACANMAPLVASGANFVKRYGNGVVRLMRDGQRQMKEKGIMRRISFGVLARRIRTAMEKKSEPLLAMAMAHAICYLQEGKERSYYLSIYNLVLHAAEWLDVGKKMLQKVKMNDALDDVGRMASLREEIRLYLSNEYNFSGVPRESSKTDVSEESEEDILQTQERTTVWLFPGMDNPDDEIVNLYLKWITTYSNVVFATSPTVYYRCWRRFLWRCEDETKDFALRYVDAEKAPKAGVLFKAYMKAFENALYTSFSLNLLGENDMCSCIREFPLWKVLNDSDEETSLLYKDLNEVNVGSTRYQIFIDNVRQAEIEVEKAQEALEKAEKELKAQESPWKKARDAEEQAELVLNKSKAKAPLLDKKEADAAAIVTDAGNELERLKRTSDDLWKVVETSESKIARLEASLQFSKTKGGDEENEEISIQSLSRRQAIERDIRKKKGSLKRTNVLPNTRERLSREIKDLESQLSAITQVELDEPEEGVLVLAAEKASLRVVRERILEVQKQIPSAQRALDEARKSAQKIQNENDSFIRDCIDLEEVWKNKKRQAETIRKKYEELQRNYECALSHWKEAVKSLDDTKAPDKTE